jgi:hypothetical protein
MPEFIAPAQSITNKNQTPSNSNSNYISPSNTDNYLQTNNPHILFSVLACIFCLIFMTTVVPFFIELSYVIQGRPRSYEHVIDLDHGREYYRPRY